MGKTYSIFWDAVVLAGTQRCNFHLLSTGESGPSLCVYCACCWALYIQYLSAHFLCNYFHSLCFFLGCASASAFNLLLINTGFVLSSGICCWIRWASQTQPLPSFSLRMGTICCNSGDMTSVPLLLSLSSVHITSGLTIGDRANELSQYSRKLWLFA